MMKSYRAGVNICLSWLDHWWTAHFCCHKLIAGAQPKIYTLLLKLRRYITAPIALQIVKTFILPRLEYGDLFITGAAKKRDVDKIQKMLNASLRLALCPTRSGQQLSNYELHRFANLLPKRTGLQKEGHPFDCFHFLAKCPLRLNWSIFVTTIWYHIIILFIWCLFKCHWYVYLKPFMNKILQTNKHKHCLYNFGAAELFLINSA